MDVGESKVIELNVGGYHYSTSIESLIAVADSNLYKLVIKATKDSQGRYFIDRDGKTFKYVIRAIRSPSSIEFIPNLKRGLVLEEFAFLGLKEHFKFLKELEYPTTDLKWDYLGFYLETSIDRRVVHSTVNRHNPVCATLSPPLPFNKKTVQASFRLVEFGNLKDLAPGITINAPFLGNEYENSTSNIYQSFFLGTTEMSFFTAKEPLSEAKGSILTIKIEFPTKLAHFYLDGTRFGVLSFSNARKVDFVYPAFLLKKGNISIEVLGCQWSDLRISAQ
jgi:hypothetical protein